MMFGRTNQDRRAAWQAALKDAYHNGIRHFAWWPKRMKNDGRYVWMQYYWELPPIRSYKHVDVTTKPATVTFTYESDSSHYGDDSYYYPEQGFVKRED